MSPPLRNIYLKLAYDGSAYCGWQVQPNGPTLQAALERGIQKLTGETVSVLSAGRTDSGVHAVGQVASFHTASSIPAVNWAAALQTHLPEDILIRESRAVPAEFHATFSAVGKRYRYVLHNGPAPLPFLRNYVYHVRRTLDSVAMHAAAQLLVGTHDFRSFETDWPNKASSVRTVRAVTVARCPAWPVWSRETELPSAAGHETRDFIYLDIEADGFLYNMVRSIMGTLINVGRGRWTAADVDRILKSQLRAEAGSTAPACGLYLMHVDYPPEEITEPPGSEQDPA